MVDGCNRCIRAMSLRFGRPGEDDQSGHEATRANDHWQEPGPFDRSQERLTFADRAGRQIAHNGAEKKVGCLVDRHKEGDGAETRYEADRGSEQQPLGQVPGRLKAVAAQDRSRGPAEPSFDAAERSTSERAPVRRRNRVLRRTARPSTVRPSSRRERRHVQRMYGQSQVEGNLWPIGCNER